MEGEVVNNTYTIDSWIGSRSLADVNKDIKTRGSTSVNPSANDFANEGNKHYENADYDGAIIAYTKAIELEPEETEYYFYRGYSYLYLSEGSNNQQGAGSRGNNRRSALEDFNEGTDLDPNDPDFYLARAELYKDPNYGHLAISEYDKLIEMDPGDSSYYKSRGQVYAESLDYEEAIEDFNTAIELDPSDAEAYSHRGLAYGELEQFDKADADFNRAARLRRQS